MQIKFSNYNFIILLFVCVSNAFGQINDDFSGNTFNASGLWSGNLDNFTRNSAGQGQLNAPSAGSSYFSTPVTWQDSTEFSFYVKMNFAPSSSNRLSIYLQNEQSDLTTGNGLFMSIGVDGSDDGVKLLFGSQSASIPLVEAGNGQFADVVDGTFKGFVTQSHLTIEFQKADLTTVSIYNGARPDDFKIGEAGHFGFWMIYTATRKDQFYFDNIHIQKLQPDTQGPVVTGLSATGLNSVTFTLNESANQIDLNNISNYELKNGAGEIINISDIEISGQNIIITTQQPLNINPNSIKISNLKDLIGNVMVTQTIEFSYLTYESALLYDILINELLPDPSPQIGLPNGEFIELYNNSNKTLQLSQYKILKSSTIYNFPKYNFLPGSYVILVPNSELGLWSSYANVIGLTSFPTLNNDGVALILQDSAQNTIHSISYNLSSYRDETKKDGGWSLEHTIKEGICDGTDVWKASNDVSGGTPGRQNTNTEVSSSPLSVLNVTLMNDQTLEVCLSKTINFEDSDSKEAFKVVNTPGFIILYANALTSCVIIQFDEPLQDGVWYEISIGSQLSNCIDILVPIDTIIGFGKGFAKPMQGEVLVNEILFNPATGGYDYVEFYNISDKTFDLQGLAIVNSVGAKTAAITKTSFIRSKEYIVFCQSKTWLESNYKVLNPGNVIEMTLPSFNDDEGNVTLWNGDVMVDSFTYSDKMHSVFLSDDEGTSLERVSESISATEDSNWQSAASDIGGGTPTYRNSQARDLTPTDKILTKKEDHFSPNGDGFLDQFLVQYHLDKPGYILRWRVFDAKGRSVKTDNPGLLSGVDGFISWDGSTDDNTRALAGIYVIEFQFTHEDGSNKKEKISSVLSY